MVGAYHWRPYTLTRPEFTMKTIRLSPLLATIMAFAIFSFNHPAPANAQGTYNYRIGDTRVQAGHQGLVNPGGTYISGGTLSQSAQAGAGLIMPPQMGPNGGVCGMTPGVSANPMGLQQAKMGSTVGVAGDYMRSDLNPNWTIQQKQQYQQQRIYRQNNYYQQPRPVVQQIRTTYGAYGSSGGQPSGQASGQVSGQSSGASSYGSSGSSSYKGY